MPTPTPLRLDRKRSLVLIAGLALGAAVFGAMASDTSPPPLAPLAAPSPEEPAAPTPSPATAAAPAARTPAAARSPAPAATAPAPTPEVPKPRSAATFEELAKPFQPEDNGAQLRTTDTILDLGLLTANQLQQRTFTLHNDGTGPLKIGHIKAMSGAVRVKFDREIPAGGTGTLEVTILGNILKPGPFRHSLEIYCNDPASWMIILQGMVGPAAQR